MAGFSIYSLKGNPDAEKNGVWVFPYGPEDEDFPGFKLAKPGGANKTYDKELTAQLRPYQKLITAQKDNPDEKTLELVSKAQRTAFIKACVKDWKNVPYSENPLPFSVDECEKLFDAVPRLFDDLVSEAQSTALFSPEDVEEEAKNS